MEKRLRDKLPSGRFAGVSQARSGQMSAVKARGNRTTELRLRFGLVKHRVQGWRMHVKSVPGTPDFFFERKALAVFVDGCFWHRCPRCGHTPKTNSPFWAEKLARNCERDRAVAERLRAKGISVIRVGSMN